MYNPRKIIELIESYGIQKKTLLDYLGKNWNGSVEAIIKGDIRVSKLEKIADFFGVPVDTFFDRDPEKSGVTVSGSKNQVHHFSVNNNHNNEQHLRNLIDEKDKRIKLLEEMIELLRNSQNHK